MAASEELVGGARDPSKRKCRKNNMADNVKKFLEADLLAPGKDKLALEMEKVPDSERSQTAPALPVFWDGTPGTLVAGVVCREGKESAIVQAIIPCVNGHIILGHVLIDGQPHNIHVTHPKRHPLADVADEEERRKLWEYDQK